MRSLLVSAAAAAVALAPPAAAGPTRYPVVRRPVRAGCTLPDARPPPAQRTFVSPAVDAAIEALLPRFKDPNLGRLFANALPNALDTTVFRHTGPDDTFIVTGDIDAMWLRDSTNQVLPYLRFVGSDPALRDLIVGLIARQARSVLLDPYANAFQLDDLHGQGPHADEDSSYRTAFAGTTVSAYTPAIFERKWEVDSLANVLRLSFEYWNATGDVAPFTNATWLGAVATILQTFADQQADTEQEDAAGGPAYTFQRPASNPTDTLQQGRGMPVKYTGLIKSAFRGSDDATTFSFSVPENAFASVQLRRAAVMLRALGQGALATQADGIAATVEAGLAAHAVINHPVAGRVWAFELDGFGNALFMDDANIPSLLAMPYYGFANASDPLYQATRAGVLSSASNPFYFNGTAGAGIGGPHNGPYFVWPMALIAQAWTAQSDAEIESLLTTLVGASACTGLTHESFDKNSFFSFTRPWFAWANSLFGDLILKLADERPQIIFTS